VKCALVTRRGLATAAAIRGAAPSSESLPPMIDWPPDLRAASDNPSFFVHGDPVERVERRGEGRS